MTKFFLTLSILTFNYSVSQIGIDDIGKKSFYQVKNSESISPCEVTENKILTYCIEDGSKLSFIFKNSILNGILTMTAFSTNYAAERALETEVSDMKSSTGMQPYISKGKTFFNTLDSPIFMTYSVEYTDETYYLVHFIAKK